VLDLLPCPDGRRPRARPPRHARMYRRRPWAECGRQTRATAWVPSLTATLRSSPGIAGFSATPDWPRVGPIAY
jgi:hypothetical protein